MTTFPTLENFDPRAAGFRCGLEVHQQLLTEKKLFCRCPAGIYSDEYNAQVLRHMRPTLSELGEYDGTALMEFKTKKNIIYRLNKESVCTYEMDDTPPFLINMQAVDIAIEIALLLNCSIVGELHVIRKQYLDGSIPAGFQRTAIVGVNGWIPYKDRKIGIYQLAVEEDACREISDVGHLRIYATDRLAMPLIEVVTAPDILEPQEGYEVGMLIGRLLRATGKVRRGIGSVRQDVNVSVTGGTRIEIKGVPRLPLIPNLVYHEAFRQYSLLNLRDQMKERCIVGNNIASPRFDVTGKLDHPAITATWQEGYKITALLLKDMSGLFAHPLGPNRTFVDDVAGRVRVISCLEHRPVMLHTDDHSQSGFSDRYLQSLKTITGMNRDDLVVVVWGPPRDVETAMNEVEIRLREATVLIPNETRQVMATGETDFERILPGPNRMYPDTDSPPLAISLEHVARIREKLPELPWVREKRYRNLGLPAHLAYMLAISERANLFDKLVLLDKIPPMLAATVLIELLTHFKRLGGNLQAIDDANLQELFDQYRHGELAREGFRLLLEAAAQDGTVDWRELARKAGLRPVDVDNVVSACHQIIDELVIDTVTNNGKLLDIAMGKAMANLRGSASGAVVAATMQNILNNRNFKH